MNEPNVYYVKDDKSFGAATELPEGAYPISKDTYDLLVLNPEYLDIDIRDNTVHLTVSLISYRKNAIAEVHKMVGRVEPSKNRLDCLMCSVITQQGCFDPEAQTMLTPEETKELLAKLVAHQNRVRYHGHKHRTRIKEAESPREIDAILESLENLIGTI